MRMTLATSSSLKPSDFQEELTVFGKELVAL